MSALTGSLGFFVFGGVAAVLARRFRGWCGWLGATGATAGCALLLLPAAASLAGRADLVLTLPWAVPGGAWSVGVDAVSGLFLLVLGVIGGAASLYGARYLAADAPGRSAAAPWVWLNVLLASMTLVLVAHNAILFLVAWEMMTISSFFLVTRDDDREEVRDAGWTYLVAAHLGTACLLALFAVLGRGGSMEFDRLAAAPGAGGALFLLALLGFGVKAGLVPLHIWLPEAHPAAPSHVSALMSGVMVTCGTYGLVRSLGWLGPVPGGWGLVLVVVGAVTGVVGALNALAQRDLKRALAYSTIEHAGVIALGLGLGLAGAAAGRPDVAVAGVAGACWHVVSHGILKSLLFLGAGAVAHATGTRDLERMGGLWRRMPRTAALALGGSAALAGLPPGNAFAGEFLIALAALRALTGAPGLAATGALVLAALGLIAGLGAAGFLRIAGIAWLGSPRDPVAAGRAHEPPASMLLPMAGLAGVAVALALAAPIAPGWAAPVVARILALPVPEVEGRLLDVMAPVGMITLAGAAFAGLTAALMAMRRRALAGRPVRSAPTWGCGYAAAVPRAQYTASSFARPLLDPFRDALGTGRMVLPPAGLFPTWSTFTSETPDLWEDRLFRPLFALGGWLASPFRRLQQGHLQVYVLYIAATLVFLLMWNAA